jgi:hypothetical protein
MICFYSGHNSFIGAKVSPSLVIATPTTMTTTCGAFGNKNREDVFIKTYIWNDFITATSIKKQNGYN